ncbi:MAG TPA: hypothetical protein ENK15_03260 [Thermopetrobacter sp.]|nr:hypothetical protein [Thermopetrobacter sp.]
MRIIRRVIPALAAAALLAAAPAVSAPQDADTGHKFEKAVGYYTECKNASREEFQQIKPYLKAFTDAELMAGTVNDPEKFFKLMEVVNDPRTLHVMMSCATEPVMWNTWMKGATDFGKMMSAATKLMNPAGLMKWMMAPMNPKIWQSMMKHLEGQRLQRWGTAATNPAFYKPLTNFFDVDWYAPRLAWFVDAASYSPLLNMFKGVTRGLGEASAEKKTETK